MARKLYSTDPDQEEDLSSRSDARRERMKNEEAMLELAGQLTGLDPLDFERLALPEALCDSVVAARACKAGKPRNRALRHVRSALRDLEAEFVDQIRERLI